MAKINDFSPYCRGILDVIWSNTRVFQMCIFCLFFCFQHVSAEPQKQSYMGMSLTELMDIKVTSVTKTSQSLFNSAASVYVLTGDDIERSGVTSLPDALRLIPGIEVSRADANKYTVSMRGFTSVLANKLLVLIDGRPVYDPLFAGVFWESRVVALETIDHIEVVRGPGGAVWGANAVNGVINIVTKPAHESERALISGAAGTRPQGYGFAQTSSRSPHSAYRLSASMSDDNHGYSSGESYDERQSVSADFRMDYSQSPKDQITVLAGGFNVDAGQGLTEQTRYLSEHTGANASVFWTRTLNRSDKFTSQLITDYFKLDHPSLNEERHHAQLEIRHEYHPSLRHQILWGGTYEYRRDFVDIKSAAYLDPSSRNADVFSVFAQDHFDIVEEKLTATIGSKLEHNVYTGFEVQPIVNLGWLAHKHNFVWASASRAVRTPSRLEADIAVGGVRLGDKFKSENLIGCQVGNRTNLSDNLSFDVTGFLHDYDNLISGELDGYHNDMYGQMYGIEADARWQLLKNVRLQAGYAYIEVDMGSREGSHPANATNATTLEDYDPRNTATFRALFDPSKSIELDGMLRYVDHVVNGLVPSYFVGDFRVGWKASQVITLSVVARDLFNPHHFEQANGAIATEVEPTFYGKLTFAVE